MKLNRAVITGFRSIRNTQKLELDELVTILIGANDHGKSNVLQALLALNDDRPFAAEDRHWDKSEAAFPRVEWHFDLTPAEISSLDAEGKHRAQVEDNGRPSFASTTAQPLGQDSSTAIYYREGLGNPVLATLGRRSPTEQPSDMLLRMRPRVELFNALSKISDEVEAFQLEEPEFEFMQGILKKANLWDKRDRIFEQSNWSSRQLAEASERLTKVFREEWEQGKELEWRLEHGGNQGSVIHVRIKDPAVSSTYVKPSQRSSGFTSFFALGLTVFARTFQNQEQAFIYLFDEPGTYLHPLAQVNLQRVFERLAERTQIVYATHSIFLLNKNMPTRNRLIRKTMEGTLIDQKPFSHNWKAVRDSLGIFRSHNFLIADRTLLVEGPSDVVYISSVLQYLVGSGNLDIDLNSFSIEDTGNSRNMTAMAKLLLDEGRGVVVLVDGDKHGRDVEKKICKIGVRYATEGRLAVLRLADGCSIENLVGHGELWFGSVKDACQQLIDEGVLWLNDEVTNIPELVRKLADEHAAANNKRTLGKLLETTSREWFKPKEPISKLNVAICFKDRLEKHGPQDPHLFPNELNSFIANLIESLKLPSRKAESLIFEPSGEVA